MRPQFMNNSISSQDVGGTAVKPPHPASAGDWEHQRENFQRLYSIYDNSLSVVIAEMKSLYGFEATCAEDFSMRHRQLLTLPQRTTV